MSTEQLPKAVEPVDSSTLAHAPDPSTPGVVTVYDPDSEGSALATQWLTVDEDLLRDVADWC